MATHEGPSVGPLKTEILKEGMVFTIEPGIYIPGKGGIRLEEMVGTSGEWCRTFNNKQEFLFFLGKIDVSSATNTRSPWPRPWHVMPEVL